MTEINKRFVITTQNAKEYADRIAAFIENTVRLSGCSGAVVGMSGGIDCSVAAALCKRGGTDVLLVMMPDGDDMIKTQSMLHANALITKFGFESHTVNIKDICTSVEAAAGTASALSEISKLNIRPRVRMTVLYAIAQSKNRLVMGTGNLDERLVGYFTKWGDGGSDFNPLGMLTKGEVRILARELGIPEEIITKPPTAGLYDGQTDEKELGFSYQQIDSFILNGTSGDANADKLISSRIAYSAHKIKPITIFYG